MRFLERTGFAGITAALFAGVVIAGNTSALAQDKIVIARSAKLGFEIRAEEGWCATHPLLDFVHGAESSAVGKEDLILPKLDPVFAEECPVMEAAAIVVFGPDGKAGDALRITRESGWSVVARTDASEPEAEEKIVAEAVIETPKSEPDVVSEKAPEPVVVEVTKDTFIPAILKLRPELKKNDEALNYLVAMRDCAGYQEVWNNEFQLRDWRKKRKAELIEDAKTATTHFTFGRGIEFERYNFEKNAFPFKLFEPDAYVEFMFGRSCVSSYDVPVSSAHRLYFPNQTPVTALSMTEQRARDLTPKFQNVHWSADRLAWVEYVVELESYLEQERFGEAYRIRVVSANVFTGQKPRELVAEFNEEDLERRYTLARLEEERAQAEKERLEREAQQQELREQAQRYRDWYDAAPAHERVGLVVLGPDGLTDAPSKLIAEAAISEDAVPFRYLVRTGEQDDDRLAITWPPRLSIKSEDAELPENEWVAIRDADLKAEERDGLLSGSLVVKDFQVCGEDMCADEAAFTAYLREALPEWDGTLPKENNQAAEASQTGG